MTSEQFFFAVYILTGLHFFSGHVPCKFILMVIFFSEGEGRGVEGLKIGSICVSP